MKRKTLISWLPLALFALVLLTPLRPIVLGGLQRALLGRVLKNIRAGKSAAGLFSR